MVRFLTALAATFFTFMALDVVWFATVVQSIYYPRIEELLLPHFRVVPAVAFYVIYTLALVVLAVRPDDCPLQPLSAAGRGFLLGLASYGAYELTNLSTLQGWSEVVTGIDLLWGGCLSAISSFVGSIAVRRIFATQDA